MGRVEGRKKVLGSDPEKTGGFLKLSPEAAIDTELS